MEYKTKVKIFYGANFDNPVFVDIEYADPTSVGMIRQLLEFKTKFRFLKYQFFRKSWNSITTLNDDNMFHELADDIYVRVKGMHSIKFYPNLLRYST